ncbi:unnamed protein product [Malus baccata var. baccata]
MTSKVKNTTAKFRLIKKVLGKKKEAAVSGPNKNIGRFIFKSDPSVQTLAARLKRLYESWEDNPDVGFVLMKREGLLFWADAVSLYQLVNEGNVDECKKFFEMLYKFMHIQGTYLKPHVAIMDCITMGAGASLVREYRISLAAISNRVSGDFSEGVRARLVDKDYAPKWNPPSLKDVAKDMVDCYFSRLPEAADIIARAIYARERCGQGLVSSRVVKSFRNRVVSAES